jgi:hypothetical protein
VLCVQLCWVYLIGGVDLEVLSDMMGHEGVQTTAEMVVVSAGDCYAILRRKELDRKHQEFSPVAVIARERKLSVAAVYRWYSSPTVRRHAVDHSEYAGYSPSGLPSRGRLNNSNSKGCR